MQHAGAVFVDPSGRRHTLVVRTAWALSALGVAYVALVVASLLLPPSLSRLSVPGLGPVLPGPAAAPLGAAEGESEAPAVLLVRTPSPTPSAPRRPTPRATTRKTATPAASRTPAPVPSATSAAPSAAPTRTTGRPTADPGQTAGAAPTVPPGQADRSPKPRPTPSKGPR